MNILLAALPIVTVALLLSLKVPALRAVVITLGLTAVLTVLRFPIAADDVVQLGPALAETIAIVVVIVIGGTSLAELLTATGAQARIADWLQESAHSQGRAILVVGLGVAPFAETIIGWGLGLVVSVPLLIRVGLSVRKAATIGLLGILLGPWGSLAPAILIMAQLGDVPFQSLGLWIAVFALPGIIIMSAAILLVGVGRRKAKEHAIEAAVAVLAMWLTILAVSWLLGPPLAGVAGACAAIVTLLMLGRLKHGQPIRVDRAVLRALGPYIFLGSGLLISAVTVRFLDIGKLGEVLAGPALWLTITVFVAPRLLRAERPTVATARRDGWHRAGPVALTTMLFVAFGGLLSMNGMSAALAGAVASLGSGFAIATPLVSALAGFVTGSNSASASMLAPGLSDAATGLAMDPTQVLAIVMIAASSAVMVCPPRLALAVSLAQSSPGPTGEATLVGVDVKTTSKVMQTVLVANVVLLLALMAIFFTVIIPG